MGRVSIRGGVLPLRYLQMALRLDPKSDGVTLTMPVVDGAITGLRIMAVSSTVLSRRPCNKKRRNY